ncbi:MAG: glycerol-3-phosphate 1-O-acyltransferase PlsY [Kiritimatiellae bacterium]|nr:glycerol-3-phosphate 1-O-acyltransferase PlsY [Kiritimatiellia bacterium]
MDKAVVWTIWAVGAYLVGSIPFGFLVGKMRGKDVRTLGSKNIGATNVYRTVGKPWGILAFACDFLKGLLPTLAAQKWGGADWLPLMVGILTVAGHMWTCFMKFKGGKGIATGFGMLVALTPVLVLTAFGVWIAVMLVSHYVSLGSIAAAAFLMVAVWFPCGFLRCSGYHDLPLCMLVSALCAFAIWKHRANMVRLLSHAESKIY